jgi:16S rRNA (cytosine967-C5)-methyltransferase
VERLPGFGEGVVSVQDWAAQQAAPLLDVRPGMRVLDACAAPGGKTAHIAELADCDLTAVDSDESRLKRLRQNLSRLKLSARVICADAADARASLGGPAGANYDRILLDAPCSASGVARRHPDIKWLRRESDLAPLARAQSALLEALWPRLAPGGQLLYVTCSVFMQENGARIARFVAARNDAELLPINGFADNIALAGPAARLDEDSGANERAALEAGLREEARTAGCQILPGGDTDGFYFAMLRKKPA